MNSTRSSIKDFTTNSNESSSSQIPIDSIKIGSRFRNDLGDIASLTENIREIGLLHPIVINQNRELICGLRRIEAFKSLVKSEIPAHVVNLDDIVKGEISENTQRKDFSLEEIIQIKKAVEPEIKTESKKRKLSDKPASTKSFSNSANNIKTETDNSKPHQGSNLPSQPKSYTSTELCRHNPSSKLVNIFRHRLQTLQIMLTCLT
jgi:ParB family chromosome partitioning protein